MNRKKTTPPADFRAWTPDFDEWPERWMGMEEDLDYGRRLLPYFADFLQALLEAGLSRKTFVLYRDNLWLLGGTIISRVNLFEEYADDPLEKLTQCVEGGGILPDHFDQMSTSELDEFARLCRRFEKYLKNNQPRTRWPTPQDAP
ncbi:MAG: hypothetical protein RBS95_05700 [Desulfobulbus sp.]|jgi:hypothetical protein|nr:hypothetical protein [Desulfobulbus sp.]